MLKVPSKSPNGKRRKRQQKQSGKKKKNTRLKHTQNFWMLSMPMIMGLQGEAGNRVASSARRKILALRTRPQDFLDLTRTTARCAHLNRTRCACLSISHDNVYMIAVTVSSSRAEAERKTCNGCFLRRDQEVRLCHIPTIFRPFTAALQRDQADREARFSRSCKLIARYSLSSLTLLPSSCTICNCHGRFVSVHARFGNLNRFLAYEGQSGSKDRGDPEVTERLHRHPCSDQ